MTTAFSPKDPAEAIYYGIDFAALLGTGETISSATASIRVLSGKDHANLTGMLSGSPVIDGSIVKHKVAGGQAGTTYQIGISIVTSAGQTFVEAGSIAVVEVD